MFRILLIVGIVVATVTTSLIVLNLSNQDKKDILKTGDPTTDAFDNVILEESSRAGWPDPMLIKAQISQESDFNQFENTLETRWASPCGLKEGWTENESQSFGLLQITPACGGEEAAMGIYPIDSKRVGHPVLVTEMNDTYWDQSLYNGKFNIGFGMYIASKNLEYLKQSYEGCSESQYLLMSLAAHNDGRKSVFGCDTFSDKAHAYIENILDRYHAFSEAAGYIDRFS